jgi:hypothetical protein
MWHYINTNTCEGAKIILSENTQIILDWFLKIPPQIKPLKRHCSSLLRDNMQRLQITHNSCTYQQDKWEIEDTRFISADFLKLLFSVGNVTASQDMQC